MHGRGNKLKKKSEREWKLSIPHEKMKDVKLLHVLPSDSLVLSIETLKIILLKEITINLEPVNYKTNMNNAVENKWTHVLGRLEARYIPSQNQRK